MDRTLLTREQERALAIRVQGGDRAARNELVERNRRLVYKVAARFLGRGLDFDDLVGEGNLGLLRAADGFDPAHGCRFSTYAVKWVHQFIRRAVQETATTIRVPVHTHEIRRKVHRARQRGEAFALKPDWAGMIADAERALALSHGSGAIEFRAADRSRDPSAPVETADEIEMVRRQVARLSRRDRELLTRRYGLDGQGGAPLTAVGNAMNLSHEAVRLNEARALQILRKRMAC